MVERHRISCCVPFCRRWRHADRPGSDWICWDHWKQIPLKRRQAYFRAVAERAPEWLSKRKPLPRWMRPRPARVCDRRSTRSLFRIWDRLKRDAIERAL